MENAGVQEYRNHPNELLRKERHLRGWSLKYIADRISCPDVRLIRRWESGDAFPGPADRQKGCQLFEKNADELGLIRKCATKTKKTLNDDREQGIHLVGAAQVSIEHRQPSTMMDEKEMYILPDHDDTHYVAQRTMKEVDRQHMLDQDTTMLVYGIIIGMSLGSLVRRAQ